MTTLYWEYVGLDNEVIITTDKRVAREVARSSCAGVFWERDWTRPDYCRPIFVGPAPGSCRPVKPQRTSCWN